MKSLSPAWLHATVLGIFLLGMSHCSKRSSAPPAALLPIPTPSQVAWHRMEMNAFVHFTTNTFTDKEWGYGDESPDVFNPTQFNADQWAVIFKETGFKGLILTCKHHDGFCLWPSQFTDHSVKSSKWMDGKGDVVKAVAEATKKQGLAFGIYLSPWDRNHKDYGTPAYVDYYRNQLKELITNYGPVFEMWFDGANGGDGFYGGKREKRTIDGATYYHWPATLDLVRGLEPNIIFFSDAGPGVRWVGNEKGTAGETNWCMISTDTLYAGKAGIGNLLNHGDENGTSWVPAETDVSIRPGWFYHSAQDTLVKSPEQLFEIYLTSVGRGSTLLLNVPPDHRGLLHENDVNSLRGLREILDREFKTNLTKDAVAGSGFYRGGDDMFSPARLIDNDPETFWSTDDGITSESITFDFQSIQAVKYVLLQEYIQLGQRVKSFKIEARQESGWVEVAMGTTIGYKRILRFGPIETDRIKITILDSRACPLISNIEVY